MKRKDTPSLFRFRQFSVSHSASSMKVGEDGVLLGAWGAVEGDRGLDIGCGCGLIALMAAQRNPVAVVEAIDIHRASVEEAAANFEASPWSERLKASETDATSLLSAPEDCGSYDFILSNPPFFNSGLANPSTSREKARHAGDLSPKSLLAIAGKVLRSGGTLSLIMPYDDFVQLKGDEAEYRDKGLTLERICRVADRPGRHPRRAMAIFIKGEGNKGEGRKGEDSATAVEELFVRNSAGDWDEGYIALTREFYLGLKRTAT